MNARQAGKKNCASGITALRCLRHEASRGLNEQTRITKEVNVSK